MVVVRTIRYLWPHRPDLFPSLPQPSLSPPSLSPPSAQGLGLGLGQEGRGLNQGLVSERIQGLLALI